LRVTTVAKLNGPPDDDEPPPELEAKLPERPLEKKLVASSAVDEEEAVEKDIAEGVEWMRSRLLIP
jgi:hypothetical protein